MNMTASLGWPCEKTTFPLGYVATRRGAPADVRKASASKEGRFSRGSTRRAFALGIGSRANYLTRRRVAGESDRRRSRLRCGEIRVEHQCRRIVNREEVAQPAVFREITRQRPRGGHG